MSSNHWLKDWRILTAAIDTVMAHWSVKKKNQQQIIPKWLVGLCGTLLKKTWVAPCVKKTALRDVAVLKFHMMVKKILKIKKLYTLK